MPTKTTNPIAQIVNFPRNNIAAVIGGPERYDNIPLATTYAGFMLHIRGVLTVAVAPAVLVQDGILNLINNIRIVASGSSLQKQMDAETLLKNIKVVTGKYPTVQQPIVAIGANAFYMVIPIYFAAIGHGNAIKTLLNARRLASLSLELTVGVDAAISTPGGAGTSVVTPALLTMQAYSWEDTSIPGNKAFPLFNEEQIATGLVFAPAAAMQDICQLSGNQAVNALKLRTETALAVNSDAIFTDIEIWGQKKGEPGSKPILRTNWQEIQEQNRISYEGGSDFIFATAISAVGVLCIPFDLVGFARIQIDRTKVLDVREMLNPAQYEPNTLMLRGICAVAGAIWVNQESISAPE